MRWSKIYQNNEAAFRLAQKWLADNNTALVSYPSPLVSIPKTIRDLYEFFDIYNIHIQVDWLYEEMTDEYDFEGKIYTKERYPDYAFCSMMYKSRSQAEHETFERAFEMLQKMISDGKV